MQTDRASIAACRAAVRKHPNDPEAHNNLGIALFAAGKAQDALAAFERAVALRGDFVFALDNIGSALQRLGRSEEARAFHEQAISLDPTFARAYVNLGNSLVLLLDSTSAQVAFERALAIDPKNAEAHNGLGAMLQAHGREAEAIEAYRTALALNPGYAEAACNLGATLRSVGKTTEGIEWLERAIELAPRNARYYRYLGETRPEVAGSSHLLALERLANDVAELPSEQQIELHFALGRAYGEIGRYDESFRHLHAGNALKRKGIDYDEAVNVGFLDGLPNSFTELFLSMLDGAGNPSERPVFIFGMPRSGTTLVEQVLAAHPAVHGAGELDAMERVINAMPRISATSSLDELRAAIRGVGDQYLLETDQYASGSLRVTDKMPSNSIFAPLIHLALPNARLIEVRRDPVDTCISCYSMLFARGISFSYDLGELGRYYRAHEKLMDRWHAILPADRFLRVNYESLVENFEEEARRLVAFCGVPWDDRCLEFFKADRPVRTASHSQVRQPLYRNAVGRAHHYAAHLGPLVEALRG